MAHHDPDRPDFPLAIRRPNARGMLNAKDNSRQHGVGSDMMSPTFLLSVLRQWWIIVLPIGTLLAAAAGALVMYFYVPQFEATALIMIEDVSPYVAFANRDENHSSQVYVQTQLELLRSPVVLEPLLSRPEIASMRELANQPDHVKVLQDSLAIKRVGQSELYNVSYHNSVATTAASVVNSLILAYIDMHTDDELQRSQRVIDILEEERGRMSLEVERLRKRVVDLAKEVTGKDPFGDHAPLDFERALSPIGTLFQSLTQADVDREVMQAEIQALTESPASSANKSETPGLFELEIESRPDVREKMTGIQVVQTQMDELKSRKSMFYNTPQWETDPAYMGLKEELQRRQTELADLKTKARDIVQAERKEKRDQDRVDAIAKAQHELDMVDTRKEFLSKRFASQVSQLKSGEEKSVELEFARAELARAEKVFELIASRKLALQTELRAPARVQFVQKANVPAAPLEPLPYKLLFLACSATFFAPFGLALIRETTVPRISDVEQLSRESRLRVLGEITSLPVRYVAASPGKLPERLRRDMHVFAESINSLRTNLTLAEDLVSQHVLAVTSASPGEGKTSVATSLAMSIANATEQPALLIDADMRSPDVASTLKTKSHPGLFEVLSKTCEWTDAIHRVGKTNLYVMPGGRATKSPHHLVSLTASKALLDQLRTRFPKIVIDTPPILGASESLVLAKVADAVLFCTLCDVSRAKQVRISVEQLEHAGVNLAGAVLSGTSPKKYAWNYGYYAIPSENVG
jgi:polysaccharide biosynthesis transport protein